MKEEIKALERNNTWTLLPRPEARKVIKCKWVYHLKFGPDGEITQYKARLVAKGFSQIQGQDYDETFSPVSRYQSIRIILALIAQQSGKWTVNHSDVKSAFLNGELKEKIFMEQPETMPATENAKSTVCKLVKCLYGLKQTSREWYEKLSKTLHEEGFLASNFDPCVFIHSSGTIIIGAYIDDLFTFNCDQTKAEKIRTKLGEVFEMTELGPANWALGINLIFSEDEILLSQKAYITRILERFQMTDCRDVSTLMEKNVNLRKYDPDEDDLIPDISLYQAMIGSLMYAVIATQPDLAFTVTLLSQYASAPTNEHFIVLKRAFRYLKATLDWGLSYPRRQDSNKTTTTVYADANYAMDTNDRKSFSGNCCLINNCLISWSAQKQKSVSVSTTEAEYKALSDTSRQLVWVKRAVVSLSTLAPEPEFELYGDNTGSLALAKNPVFHKRSKHIDVHFHYVREKLAEGEFALKQVATTENVADLFTKGLEKNKHDLFCQMLGCEELGDVC